MSDEEKPERYQKLIDKLADIAKKNKMAREEVTANIIKNWLDSYDEEDKSQRGKPPWR